MHIATLKTTQGTRVDIINSGNFLLDGGGMFGRIPKNLWQRWFPADDQNRIVMATNIIRIESQGKITLVDAGMGTRYDIQELSTLGYEPQKLRIGPIDRLICTHLHFDHVGGIHDLVIREAVFASRQEWEDASIMDALSSDSYRGIDLEALSARIHPITPPFEVDDHIQIISSPGHTRGHMSVIIDDEIFYPGDLIPTTAHCPLPCIMAYDLYPLTVIKTKQELLSTAVEKEWITIFEHDPYRPLAKITTKNSIFRATDYSLSH